ncbi:MAG: hypothetical protein ABIR91_00975 [Candidatus Saccharimonadales bacterium]
MANTNTKKPRNSGWTVTLSLWQELLLLPLYILMIALAVYGAVGVPLLTAAAIVVIIFCIYPLLSLGRAVYSKVYLAVVALAGLATMTALVRIVVGYVQDYNYVICRGFFGVKQTCVESATFSATMMLYYALVPLAVLTTIGLIFQIRTLMRTK